MRVSTNGGISKNGWVYNWNPIKMDYLGYTWIPWVMFQTSLGLRYISRASGCVAGEGNHQREQPCGATAQGFDTLQPRANIVGWNPVRPTPSSQMFTMIKLGESATKAIAASKSPSVKLTVHCSIKMILNCSAMFTMDHTLMDFLP